MAFASEAQERWQVEHQDMMAEHPGWQPLAPLFNTRQAFFEAFWFLLGYEFSSNIYLIDGDELTLVDAGNDYTAFMGLVQEGFDPNALRKIVLTHGHRDHAMGVFELLRSYRNASGKRELELVMHEASPAELKSMSSELGCRITLVKGGEILEVGGSVWEVVHTPGHTIDGISLYHAATKTAFTGDTVLTHALAEPDRNGGGRLDHYLYAIKQLLARDIENILPGHGPPLAVVGKDFVEKTYTAVMMRVIGVEDKTSWIDGAKALAQKGLFEEALFCCTKQLALEEQNTEALQLRALCLNDLGRFDEALPAFDRLQAMRLEESPQAFTLLGKGCALIGLERYPEAIACFDEALQKKPEMKDAGVYKGLALYLAGRYEEALDIDAFRSEFMGRFKSDLIRRRKA